jgi:hypothetical protein
MYHKRLANVEAAISAFKKNELRTVLKMSAQLSSDVLSFLRAGEQPVIKVLELAILLMESGQQPLQAIVADEAVLRECLDRLGHLLLRAERLEDDAVVDLMSWLRFLRLMQTSKDTRERLSLNAALFVRAVLGVFVQFEKIYSKFINYFKFTGRYRDWILPELVQSKNEEEVKEAPGGDEEDDDDDEGSEEEEEEEIDPFELWNNYASNELKQIFVVPELENETMDFFYMFKLIHEDTCLLLQEGLQDFNIRRELARHQLVDHLCDAMPNMCVFSAVRVLEVAACACEYLPLTRSQFQRLLMLPIANIYYYADLP